MKNFFTVNRFSYQDRAVLIVADNWTRKFAGKKVEIMRFRKIYTIPLKFSLFLFCLWTSIGLWIVNILQRLNVDLKAGNEAVWLLHVGVGALFVDAAQLRHHSVEEQEIVWTDPESGPKGIGGWSYSSRKTFYISLL